MASLTKRDRSPYWWIKYYPAPGQPPMRHSTGIRHDGKRKPNAEAEAYRRQIEQRQGLARGGLCDAGPVKIATVSEFLTGYVEGLEACDTSKVRYHSRMAHFIRFCATTGIRTMNQIDSARCMAFADTLKAEGLASPGPTINLVSDALKDARARNLMSWAVNPMDGIRLKGTPTPKDKQRGALTRAQVDTILAITDPPWLKTLAMFGLMTAARLSSIRILRWDDISFDFGMINFRFAKRSDGRDRSYKVPIAGELLEYLTSIKPADATGPLFPDYQSEIETPEELDECKETRSLSSAFAKRIQRAGVRASFHWLRHTSNTWAADQGMSQKARMLMSNHESEAASNHYTHADMEHLRAELAKIKFLKTA